MLVVVGFETTNRAKHSLPPTKRAKVHKEIIETFLCGLRGLCGILFKRRMKREIAFRISEKGWLTERTDITKAIQKRRLAFAPFVHHSF